MQFQDQGGEFADSENLQQMLGDLTLEDDNNSSQVYKNDSTVFIIDCSLDMLSAQHNQEPQLKIILEGYANFMKSKIISNSSDRVGLILLNVKNTNNSLNFQGIHTFQDLSQPSAVRIKSAEDLIENFATKFGIKQGRTPLHQAFWLYSHQIKDLDQNKFHLRLFLFTNQDEPHQMGDHKRQLAISHAKQLLQKNVHIQLFPIKKQEGHHFDVAKFYTEIITFDPQDINEGILDGSSKIMDLQTRLRQKQFKKRTLNRLLLNIGSDTTMGLKVFSLFNKARKPTPKKVDAATNKPLQRVTKKLNRQGQTLFDTQIGTYYPLGNQKVKFSKAEMSQIKNLEQPGMTLMGFKPRSYIKPYYNIRTSYFVYPDDEHVTGSSQFSDALISELKLRNMVAIVKVVPRASQELRFAALFPQQESFDQQDHFQTPPGFNMIFLPFAEDIANFTGQKTTVEPSIISTQLVHVTKLLINNLTISNFDFRNFQNPSLQKFYSHLQGHALNQKQIEERADFLQPDHEGLAKFQDIIDLVRQTAMADIERVKIQDSQDMDCESKFKKPKRQEKQTKGRKKRAKMSQSSQSEMYEKQAKKQEHVKKGRKKASKMVSQQSQQHYWQPQDKKMQPVKRSRIKRLDKEVKQQHQSAIKQQRTNQKQTDEGIVGIIQSLMMQGQFNSVKVADLRSYLKNFGLDSVGKKQQLIDRVLNFMSNRNSI